MRQHCQGILNGQAGFAGLRIFYAVGGWAVTGGMKSTTGWIPSGPGCNCKFAPIWRTGFGNSSLVGKDLSPNWDSIPVDDVSVVFLFALLPEA